MLTDLATVVRKELREIVLPEGNFRGSARNLLVLVAIAGLMFPLQAGSRWVATPEGLRIYGSGIVSSKGESLYCLEDARPNRLGFDLMRVMRTRYRIDDFQTTYFVIRDFAELFEATRPDFTPYYRELSGLADLDADAVLPQDRVLHRGAPATPAKG